MQVLDRQIAYFQQHQTELAEEHHGEFVLIHDESIEGFYESELDAYTAAKRRYDAGTFLIRQCLRPEEETTQTFHSRIAI